MRQHPAYALKTLAQSLGCRVPALAVSPSDSDMAVASTAGEIHIKRLAGDTGFDIPELRTITIDCQPRRESLFGSLSIDKPRACTATAMKFNANGTALAVLSNDDRLRVLRINNGPIRRGDGAVLATIALSSPPRFFGFDPNENTLIVLLDFRRGAQVRSRRPGGRVAADVGGLHPAQIGAVRIWRVARRNLRSAARSRKPADRTQRHRSQGRSVPISGAATRRRRPPAVCPALTRAALLQFASVDPVEEHHRGDYVRKSSGTMAASLELRSVSAVLTLRTCGAPVSSATKA